MTVRFYKNTIKNTIWAVRSDGMERVIYSENNKDFQYVNWHEPTAHFKERGSILNIIRNYKHNWEEISEIDIFVELL